MSSALTNSDTPRFRRTSFGLRFAIGFVIAACLLAVPGWQFAKQKNSWTRYQPEEGDVVFQSLPRSELVNTIEGATRSPWSHCGLVTRQDGKWMVCEAIGDVRMTPIDEFYARGREGRFAVCRLQPDRRKHIPTMVKECRKFLGRPYDARYRMDDEAIYCSELIFKGYRAASGESLGEMVTLGSLNWRPYQQLIERLENGPAPLEREMITPRDLADAKQFERIAGDDR